MAKEEKVKAEREVLHPGWATFNEAMGVLGVDYDDDTGKVMKTAFYAGAAYLLSVQNTLDGKVSDEDYDKAMQMVSQELEDRNIRIHIQPTGLNNHLN